MREPNDLGKELLERLLRAKPKQLRSVLVPRRDTQSQTLPAVAERQEAGCSTVGAEKQCHGDTTTEVVAIVAQQGPKDAASVQSPAVERPV